MHFSCSQCAVNDLETLVKVSRKTFIQAFEKDNDPDDFKTYIDMAFNPSKLLQELQHPETSFYFFYLGKDLAGYFKINEYGAQSDPQGFDSLELERIYVVQEFQGQGLGALALQNVLEIAESKQKNYVWLGVWQRNSKAIRFYERYGFKKFGEHPFYIGKDRQMDWLMRYSL